MAALTVGTLGAAWADATIAAQSQTTYITPTNLTATVPVNITRTSAETVRAFSVTIQLSGGLVLSTPVGTPPSTGSITLGSFFDTYTNVSFQVIDKGSGKYQVDCALLGTPCGPTALTGTLFNVGVKSTSLTDCLGAITVVTSTVAPISPRLRDCTGAVLTAVAGADGTVPIDNNAPVITLMPSNMTVYSGVGRTTCDAVASWTVPSASDLCGGTVTLVPDHASGSPFPVGTATTVTYTATDARGNTATALFTVTAVDNTVPTITAPLAVTVGNDAGKCYATGVTLGTPTTADNCGVASVTNNAPAQIPVGTATTVTWTVTDVHGNTATATQSVTVTDTEKPTITAAADVTVSNDAGLCTAVVTLTSPTTADNCGVATVTNNAPALFPVGTTSVLWTVTDVHGNTNTATQKVTVNDTEKPTITAPLAVTVGNDAGKCYATVALGTATTGDNCGVASVTNDATATFAVGGPYTVTWTVTDVHGNTATATQSVTVNDTEKPTIAGLSDKTANNDLGKCYATSVALGTPTTADNCGVATVTNNAPTPFPVGETTVTWTVTDVHDNTATATQKVTVTDNELPVVALTAPVGGETWIGGTVHSITWTATDNCGLGTADLSYSTDGGSTYPNSITTVAASTGTFSWTVPSLVSTTVRVQITARDATGNVTTVASAGNFTVTSITAIGDLTPHRTTSGNDADGTTKIELTWTATPAGTSVEIYRHGFGNYPWYDNGSSPGGEPTVVGYPPAGWTKATTVSGVTSFFDEVAWPGRDYYYYVAYVTAGGAVSAASNMTSGTLNYFLGDVTDGHNPGTAADNEVGGVDVSDLGTHYGAVLLGNDALGYLDVGPTSNYQVDGRPLTDGQIEFEDLVIFALNYGQKAALVLPETQMVAGDASAAGSDALVLERPERVALGDEVAATLTMTGSGRLVALSTRLAWDAAVVEPVSQAAGEWLVSQNGVAFSAKPGTVDAAVLNGQGMKGTGVLATVAFKVLSAGDPKIRIEVADGRDADNKKVVVAQSERLVVKLPTVTRLAFAQPNPFRGSATLAFSLAQGGRVELAIYSVDGRRVRTLVSEAREPGEYQETWDGRDDHGNPTSAGVYYARLVSGKVRMTRSIVYLK